MVVKENTSTSTTAPVFLPPWCLEILLLWSRAWLVLLLSRYRVLQGSKQALTKYPGYYCSTKLTWVINSAQCLLGPSSEDPNKLTKRKKKKTEALWRNKLIMRPGFAKSEMQMGNPHREKCFEGNRWPCRLVR